MEEQPIHDNTVIESTVSNIDKRNGKRVNPEKLAPLMLGILIGIAVCAPFFSGGYVFLLDWVVGPHTPILSPQFFGLHGGINAAFLSSIIAGILAHTFGTAATWIPIFLFFPLASMSVSRAVKGNIVAKLAASLFFCINPFVVERLYAGQLGVLYGYLLLPVLYLAVEKWVDREVTTVTHVALILTLMISIDVHYAWIGGLVVFGGIILGFKDNEFRKSVPGLLVLIVLMNIYLVIPILGQPLAVNPADNQTLLKAFSTRGDPTLGLFVNVLGLYGFWRPMHESSKNLVSGWPILLVAIYVFAIFGLKSMSRKEGKTFSRLLGITFVAGFFLALGSQGPTGPIFQILYSHLPGFSMMREPEKFSSILACVLSLLLGRGISQLSLQQTTRNATIAIIAVGAILELSYNPVIFWGIHGQVQPSKIPHSWTTVANKLKNAQGNILVLPWHLYLSFPFSQKRIIANLGPRLFPGNVIAGNNLQLGPVQTTSISQRSKYISWIIQNEYNTNHIGRLLAPIGVQYIVILKTYSTGYTSWIQNQKDLATIYSSSQIALERNSDFAGIAQSLHTLPTSNFNKLVAESNASTSSSANNTLVNIINHPLEAHITATTALYSSNHDKWINIDIPYSTLWHTSGELRTSNPFGTVLVTNKNSTLVIFNSDWKISVYGYGFSTLLILLTLIYSSSYRKYSLYVNQLRHKLKL